MIDLDRFKAINDEHGHAAGDQLLRGVGAALRGRLRETDVLGRLGGDEFVAYLPHVGAAAALAVAEQLLEVIRDASAALGDGMHTTASVGVAVDSTSSPAPDAMLRAADGAMYVAKRAGGNRASVAQRPARSRKHPRTAEAAPVSSLRGRPVRDPVV